MSWLSSFIPFRGKGSPGKLTTLAPWSDPPTPPAPPEPSCFVKGIALSFVTEGDTMWDRISSAPEGWIPVPLLHAEHHVHGIRVIAFPCYPHPYAQRAPLRGCQHLASLTLQDGVSRQSFVLTNEEEAFLGRAIESKPFGLFKETLDAEEADRTRKAVALAHFTTLGCPPQS